MNIKTDYFGDIEYSEEEIIRFEDGIYGFEDKKNFILIESEDISLPFHFFQSIDDSELMFIVTDPFLFIENYDFELTKNLIDSLSINSIVDLKILNLVVIHEKVEETTINLKSPLIINIKERKGKQTILNEDYEYRRKLFVKGIEH